ncbi:MAG: ThiF family adenylyltransferase [Deltaproteobacteria bacterium]|nr:ThiF family adenylyltransferase [Deltaproteobacteria bacterium]
MNTPDDRYSRQIRFAPIGEAGQANIHASHALIVGCGALGSSMANMLVRAGLGRLTLIDPDKVEWSNLQRQTLYDEDDARAGRLKVEAAGRRLAAINRDIQIEVKAEEVTAANIESLVGRPDVILDGTDRFPVRYLINDYAVREGLRWIYGGCAASHGTVLPIEPGRTPCLRCLFPDLPDPNQAATADTVGIIAPVAQIVAALQVAEAMKWLSGHAEVPRPVLYQVDLWSGNLQSLALKGSEANCPCCGQGRYDFLNEAQT